MIVSADNAIRAAVMYARAEGTRVYLMADKNRRLHIVKSPQKKMRLIESIEFVFVK